MNDAVSVINSIAGPKKKRNILNETRITSCWAKFESKWYRTTLEFLKAVSRSFGAHTDALHLPDSDHSDTDDVNDDSAQTYACFPPSRNVT